MISKTETFNLTVYCGLHWQPTPIFRCFPKPSHYHNKRHLYDLLQEIPRVLVALCQEWEQRPNIYFLFKNLYIYTHFFFFLLFRATPAAYGSSQARGGIGTAAAGLYHSHGSTGSKLHLRPTPQLRATLAP